MAFVKNSLNNCEPISIEGICSNQDEVNQIISNFPYWKQEVFQNKYTIPETSPDISNIDTINIVINTVRTQVIVTPLSTSPNLEGKMVTSRKVVAQGQICQIINYDTNDPYDMMRTMKVYNPISTLIVIPANMVSGSMTVDSLNINYTVNSCIEDVCATILDNRTILERITVLFYAVPQL